MPYPKQDETEKEYVDRFMGSPEANKDFPDSGQRAAVAHSMWKKRTNSSGEEGWPKLYSCTFIEPGVVFYQDLGENGETVLVQKAALDKMAQTFVGKPVINYVHKDVTPDTIKNGEAEGIVSRVYYDEPSGWYKCDFLVWDDLTQRNCESKIYSVSCAYEPTDVNTSGGTYHNMEYQEEVLDGKYTHLAIVANPRYEGARIFANSKGGNAMDWKFWKPKTEKKNAVTLDPLKTLVNVDGKPTTLQNLYDALKNEEEAKKKSLEMSDDTLMEIDGVQHTLGDLKNAFRAQAKKNEGEEPKKEEPKGEPKEEPKKNGESEEELKEPSPKKNDEAEESAKKAAAEKEAAEKKNAEDAEAKKKEEEEKKNAEDAEAKKKEEKKNAGKTSFNDLKNSARERLGNPVGIKLVTIEERIESGNKKYGSTAK